MSYLIPALLFILLIAGTVGVLFVVSRATAGPDGEKATPIAEDDNSPLWATDEASDAAIDTDARRRDEQRVA